jgi:hypothetical protein
MYTTSRLGTKYGVGTFVESDELNNVMIICCGSGEDASFDIKFASKYSAKIVIVNSTPRAIQYFNGIISKMGMEKSCEYNHNGCESIDSYDLRRLSKNQLQLCDKALWDQVDTLRFIAPQPFTRVSLSTEFSK